MAYLIDVWIDRNSSARTLQQDLVWGETWLTSRSIELGCWLHQASRVGTHGRKGARVDFGELRRFRSRWRARLENR